MTYRLKNEQEWSKIVIHLDNRLAQPNHSIVALQGDLGVGKTTFVKALMKYLGSDDLVNSPTFSIVNGYMSKRGMVYHMDLYRLESIDDLLDIGFEEYIYSGQLCIIEWPELAFPILKDSCIFISISMNEEKERIVKIS